MNRRLLLAIGIVLVLIILGTVSCNGYFSREPGAQTEIGGILSNSGEPGAQTEISGTLFSQQSTGIWVSGEGEVTVVPDVAILSLGVEAQATTVAEAQTQAAEAMEAMMGVLDDYGVASKDIKTQYYSIYPVWSWDNDTGKETLIGYRVTNTVTAKIRNIKDSGRIIDAITAAGGDYTRINSISFTVDDPDAYKVEARGKAMADAKAKAEQLAELAGVTLGKPTYIAESGGYIPIYYDYYDLKGAAEGVSAPTTPISPGEMEISLSVQVVYSIS